MPELKSTAENTENVYLEFLELTNVIGGKIYALFDNIKYRDARIRYLFTNMLMRLIEHARRSG